VDVRDLIWLGQQLAEAGRQEIRERAPGVPTAELIVMHALLDLGPSTITALAQRTGYAQSRVSTSVLGLRDRGWVKTRSDPADGRRTIVYLAEDARAEANSIRASSARSTVLEPLLSSLPTRRRETIIDALEELHEVMHGRNDVKSG
jgi:MarR family 2-MHQ and catechol resistance regulon transcriptional repressor